MAVSAAKTGGPAFPATEAHGCNSGVSGMDLRDYFAAKALPLAAAIYENGRVDGWVGIASHAYKIADAMLEARK